MGVNRLDHAAILVDDLGEAVDWYAGVLGLTLLDRNGERAHLTCRGDHADLTIVAGGHGPSSFAIGVDGADDLEAIEQRLDRNGIAHERVDGPDRPGTAEVTRFELISGHTMEFAVATAGRTAGQTDFTWDGVAYAPTDIDHINLLGEQKSAAMADFLTDVVGFRLSGAITVEGDFVGVWTRAAALDHDVAYMQAVRPGDRLHHVAFAMADGNHYVCLADRLAETGHMFEFGPGRHGAQLSGFGSNMFAYAFDPSGNRNEFSGDMKAMPADGEPAIVPVDGRVAEVMNAWAVNMPESFLTVGS